MSKHVESVFGLYHSQDCPSFETRDLHSFKLLHHLGMALKVIAEC